MIELAGELEGPPELTAGSVSVSPEQRDDPGLVDEHGEGPLCSSALVEHEGEPDLALRAVEVAFSMRGVAPMGAGLRLQERPRRRTPRDRLDPLESV